jgi:hypothetical protein
MANGVVKGFSNEVRLNPKKRVSRAKIEQNGNPTSTAARGNLVYLDGYTQKGQPRLSGIWYKTVPYASYWAKHHLTPGAYQNEYTSYLKDGYSTKCVTGYQDGGHRSIQSVLGPFQIALFGLAVRTRIKR